jgi:hypothetical protein
MNMISSQPISLYTYWSTCSNEVLDLAFTGLKSMHHEITACSVLQQLQSESVCCRISSYRLYKKKQHDWYFASTVRVKRQVIYFWVSFILNTNNCAEFEVIVVEIMKRTLLYSLVEVHWCYRWINCLHLLGQRVTQATLQQEASKFCCRLTLQSWRWTASELLPDYMASHCSKQYSSLKLRM